MVWHCCPSGARPRQDRSPRRPACGSVGREETVMTEHGGRVWFITGSTSGLGRALVDAARFRGERVVATARRPEALAELEGEDVLVLELDVTRAVAIEPA